MGNNRHELRRERLMPLKRNGTVQLGRHCWLQTEAFPRLFENVEEMAPAECNLEEKKSRFRLRRGSIHLQVPCVWVLVPGYTPWALGLGSCAHFLLRLQASDGSQAKTRTAPGCNMASHSDHTAVAKGSWNSSERSSRSTSVELGCVPETTCHDTWRRSRDQCRRLSSALPNDSILRVRVRLPRPRRRGLDPKLIAKLTHGTRRPARTELPGCLGLEFTW